MRIRNSIIIVFSAVIVVTSFGLGFVFGQMECKVCPPEEVDFSLLWEAWHKLESKYVNKQDFNTQEMIYGVISGMVDSLGDAYTIFLDPDDTKRFVEDVKGTFEGVGMEIGIRKGQLQVIAPLEGTPAQKAGLRSGDKIIKVDDVLTADLSLDEVVDIIRGPKGTTVNLTIYRDDIGESKEIPIVRGVIQVPSLKLEILDDNIAYLKLYHFSEKASFDFRKTAIEILTSSTESIILDLRDNPGGYLGVAQDIAGYFLERGQVVAIEEFGNGEQKQYLAQGTSSLVEYPMIVLINEGSASGSEILAGCLRDNRNVLLIGEKSFGKGSVQELERLGEGSSLKITVAKWLTPSGEFITDQGLEPDVEIEITDQDYEQDIDPQLDKAIEIIKEIR